MRIPLCNRASGIFSFDRRIKLFSIIRVCFGGDIIIFVFKHSFKLFLCFLSVLKAEYAMCIGSSSVSPYRILSYITFLLYICYHSIGYLIRTKQFLFFSQKRKNNFT